MFSVITDTVHALWLPKEDPVTTYERLAPVYDRIQRRWLRVAGRESVAALFGTLSAELRPGIRVLDAGCGTGTIAKWVAQNEPQVVLTMLDGAPTMLALASTARGHRVTGNLLALPFKDGAFDIVLCTWAMETVRLRRDRTRADAGRVALLLLLHGPK